VSAANWKSIEDALRTWIQGVTGFDDQHCYFADQNVKSPGSGPWVTIRLEGTEAVGAFDGTFALDRTVLGFPLTPPITMGGPAPGTEIELQSMAPRYMDVTLQAFNGLVTHGTDFLYLSGATLLTRVQASLGQPSFRDPLNSAGLGVVDIGRVQNVAANIETRFEGRGILTVRFNLFDSASDFTGYIATVTGPTGTLNP